MFAFKKCCDRFEALSAAEKGCLLVSQSVKILDKLHQLALPDVEPVSALAGFIIGSVVADGRINEQEYLLIYPSLVCVFGDDFDFMSIKNSFRADEQGRKMVAQYTRQMIRIFEFLDEELRDDVITLCMCVVAIDGRISLKEKRYIRRLCNPGA